MTAQEMDTAGDRLVRSFNEQVKRENIRYRSMLRGRHAGNGARSARFSSR